MYWIGALEVAPEHPLVRRVHAQLLVEERLEEGLRLCLFCHGARLLLFVVAGSDFSSPCFLFYEE